MTASTVATVTQRIKLLVALRTALTQPTAAARQAATLDQVSNGRLLVNVVAGGDAIELAGDGIFLDHDARYEEAREFLTIWRQLLAGETVNFSGKYHGERRAISSRRCKPRIRAFILAARRRRRMTWPPNRWTPT